MRNSRLLIINYKNHPEARGKKGIALARTIDELMYDRNSVSVSIAPEISSISTLCRTAETPLLAQYMGADAKSLKQRGAYGSMLNHSDFPLSRMQVVRQVRSLRRNDMESVLCVKTPEEARSYLELEPTDMAIEPPELIGTLHPVSKERPELIRKFAELVNNHGKQTRPLCGAGMANGVDARAAVELGMHGVLVSTAIVKARKPRNRIFDFIRALE